MRFILSLLLITGLIAGCRNSDNPLKSGYTVNFEPADAFVQTGSRVKGSNRRAVIYFSSITVKILLY